MFKKLFLGLILAIGLAVPAAAQNTTCANRPDGDSSNACANTRFVQGAGSTIVESMLGWYVVGSTQYPTPISAVTAANAAGGGVVYFPCKAPANSTVSLSSGAIGLDMRNFRNVRLVGGNSVNAGGAVCTYLHYTGTGVAIDISGSYGTEITGILIYGPASDSLIKASNQGNLASYTKIHWNTFQGKVSASGKCLDLSYIIIADIYQNSIGACYIGISGSTGAVGDTSNVINIGPGNTFQPGNSIHMQNATWWNVDNNTFEGGLLGIAYRDTNVHGKCNTLNMTANKFDDPQTTATLISTNCIQYNSKNNTYSAAAGSTIINYAASSGKLSSHSDWFDTSGTGIAFNTGNLMTLTLPSFFSGISALYSGTLGASGTAEYIGGNLAVNGATTFGTLGVFSGRNDFVGSTSGSLSVRAQAVAGSATISWPNHATTGTVVTTAAGLLAVNATTGEMTCTNCASTALTLAQFSSTTSAQLRTLLSDESGTGAAYFQGGDLGTPSAGVGTNLTALNATQLTTGTIPNARIVALTTNTNMGFGTACAAITAGTTAYFSNNGCWSGTEAVASAPVSAPITARNFYIKVGTAPGAGQTFTVRLRKNAADTNITCTISDTATTCNDTSNTGTFVAGDLAAVRIVSSAGAASTTQVNAMMTAQTTSP